jgi:hypothetical protein
MLRRRNFIFLSAACIFTLATAAYLASRGSLETLPVNTRESKAIPYSAVNEQLAVGLPPVSNKPAGDPVMKPKIVDAVPNPKHKLPLTTIVRRSDSGLAYVEIDYLGDILECEPEKTPAYGMRLLATRENDNLNCVVWTSQGKKAVFLSKFDKVTVGPLPADGESGTVAGNSTYSDFKASGVGITPISDKNGNTKVILASKGLRDAVPIERFWIGHDLVVPGYRYAVTIKETKDHNLISILIFDVEKRVLFDEIPLPQKLPRSRPTFVLDPNAHCAMAVDWDLNWCIVVDLKR